MQKCVLFVKMAITSTRIQRNVRQTQILILFVVLEILNAMKEIITTYTSKHVDPVKKGVLNVRILLLVQSACLVMRKKKINACQFKQAQDNSVMDVLTVKLTNVTCVIHSPTSSKGKVVCANSTTLQVFHKELMQMKTKQLLRHTI